MNILKIKKNQTKILAIIATLILVIMCIPAKNSVAESTGNVATTIEMEVTASADNTIEITKIWDDSVNRSNRPQSVTYTLYKKSDRSTAISTLTLNNTNALDDYTWKGTFENVPQKDGNNQPITYIVTEQNIENYISMADKTALVSNTSELDTSIGIKFKFNPSTRFVCDGSFVNMYNNSTALKLYAYDIKNDKWYGLKDEYYNGNMDGCYIFNDSKISNTLYEITIENDMQVLNSAPMLHNYIDTGDFNETLGLEFPETKHPLSIGDNVLCTYKASPKSSVMWYFDAYMASWGGGWGMKVDEMETLGNHNYFVSTYNRQDIPFTKVFEDEGFEDLREDSEFYLYGDEVKKGTITLRTSTNKNQNEWQGTFKDVPIYDANWKKIEYRIEEKKNDNYTTYYDTQEYNGLLVTFSDDSFLESNTNFKIVYKDGDRTLRATHYSNDWQHYNSNGYAYICAITNATIYIPAKEFYIQVEWTENNTNTYARLKIESIKPVANVDRGSNTSSNTIPIKEMYAHTGKDYLDFDNTKDFGSKLGSTRKIVWKYQYSDTQSWGSTRIINKINKEVVKKVWNDNGSKSTRPQSIKIDVVDEKNPNVIVKTIELTATDEDPQDGNTWKKTITGLPEFDENGYKIHYIYREQEQDNYETIYDSAKKITGYELSFENEVELEDFIHYVNIYSYASTVPEIGGAQAGNQYYYSIIAGYTRGGNTDGLTYKFIIPIKDDDTYFDKNGPKFAIYVTPQALEKNLVIKSIRPVYEDEYTVNPEYENPFSERKTTVYLYQIEEAKKFSENKNIALDYQRI